VDGSPPSSDGLLYCKHLTATLSSLRAFLFLHPTSENVFFYLRQRAKKEYNMVLLHPDDGSVESWTEEGSGDKMRADFADFEPRYVTFLGLLGISMNPSTVSRSSCHLSNRR
jgi:hypothetical protein